MAIPINVGKEEKPCGDPGKCILLRRVGSLAAGPRLERASALKSYAFSGAQHAGQDLSFRIVFSY